MAWDFEVVGWEDEAGGRHDGKPSDIDDTYGTLVYAYDDATGAYDYFWAYTGQHFDDWIDWLDYIDELMDMYGMVLA